MNSRNAKSKLLRVSLLTLVSIAYSCILLPLNVVAQPILLKVQLLFPVESGGELDTLSAITTQAKLVTVQGRTFVLVGEFTDAKVAFRLGKSLQRRVKLPFELSYDPGHPQSNFAWLRELDDKDKSTKSAQSTPPVSNKNPTKPPLTPVVKKATTSSSLPSLNATDLLPLSRQLLATTRKAPNIQTPPLTSASGMVLRNTPDAMTRDSAESRLSSNSLEAKLRPSSDLQVSSTPEVSVISDSLFLGRSSLDQGSLTVLQSQVAIATASSPATVSGSRPSVTPNLTKAVATSIPDPASKTQPASLRSAASSFSPLTRLAANPAKTPAVLTQPSKSSMSTVATQTAHQNSGFARRVQLPFEAKPSLTSASPLVVTPPHRPELSEFSHTWVKPVILGDVVMSVSTEHQMLAVNPDLLYLYVVLGEAAEAETINKLTPVAALHLHDGQILAQVGVYQSDQLGRRLLNEELNQLSSQGFTIRLIHRGETIAISQGGLPKLDRHV